MIRLVFGIAMTAVLGFSLVGAFAEERRAGRIQTVDSDKGALVIEESGVAGRLAMVKVGVRNATVVRVFRDAGQPWEWREEPAELARVPSGTIVVVIGRKGANGFVEADRVEIPRPEE